MKSTQLSNNGTMEQWNNRPTVALSHCPIVPLWVILAILVVLCGAPKVATAQDASADDLNREIQTRQQRVGELDGMIENYRSKIDDAQQESVSLENQLALLENRIKEKELGVQRATLEIESLELELRVIQAEIGAQESRIEKQKMLLGEIIRDIQKNDEITTVDVLLTEPSLSRVFAQMEEVKRLQGDLQTMLERVKAVKAGLEEKRHQREEAQNAMEEERRRLRQEQLSLEAERNLKSSLVAETKLQEQEFQRILYELRQQQQDAANDIASLEARLDQRLEDTDEALSRGEVLLNWPVDPSRGITSIFHDPTYPFRHLFEHPGTDIRASVGTPVKSAGGGYVAWNKLGRMYGNYTMVVHPGGIATVYAHLSKFLATPDTFVDRGEPIGLSGGRPGDPGAGLSTGPHLHFEVRLDGIPVDPENYLPAIPNSYYDYYDEYKALGVRP